MKTLLVCLGLWVSFASQALACDCPPLKAEDALKLADLVFAGEVTSVQYVDAQSNKLNNEPRIVLTFKVSAAWKGDVRQPMTLHTNYNKGSCAGLIVAEGDNFLIYAKWVKAKKWLGEGTGLQTLKGGALPKPEDDVLQIVQIGYCAGGSRLLVNADEHLKVLGRPKYSIKKK